MQHICDQLTDENEISIIKRYSSYGKFYTIALTCKANSVRCKILLTTFNKFVRNFFIKYNDFKSFFSVCRVCWIRHNFVFILAKHCQYPVARKWNSITFYATVYIRVFYRSKWILLSDYIAHKRSYFYRRSSNTVNRNNTSSLSTIRLWNVSNC